MELAKVARPKLVGVISILIGFMAAAQLVILSYGVSSSSSAVGNVSAFDWLTLYALAVILLTSMVFFFRQSKRAVSWFAAYIGLASWAVWGYALAPENPPFFDELVSLAGLLVALGVLGYMLKLRKRKVLA